MAAKVSKLDEQFKLDAPREKCSDIFSGVSIYVNGYTGKNSLFGLLLYKGTIVKVRKCHIVPFVCEQSRVQTSCAG